MNEDTGFCDVKCCDGVHQLSMVPVQTFLLLSGTMLEEEKSRLQPNDQKDQ